MRRQPLVKVRDRGDSYGKEPGVRLRGMVITLKYAASSFLRDERRDGSWA